MENFPSMRILRLQAWKISSCIFHVCMAISNSMENEPKFKPDPKLKLMDQVRLVLHYHHYAYRTEQTYCDWIVRYIKFHGGQTHPAQMGKTHIEAFLSHLATQGQVSTSTQRQALNAIIFLYRHILDQPIEDQLEPVSVSLSTDRVIVKEISSSNPGDILFIPTNREIGVLSRYP